MFGLTAEAIFGISLTVIALVMAAFMTVVNVSKSESDKERRYVISACVGTWLIVAVSMLLVVLMPTPYDYVPLGAVIIVFPVSVYRMSIRHQLLREKERRHSERVKRESEDD